MSVYPLYNDPTIISFFADLCRLITLIVLLTIIRRAKNSNGLSGKTLLLYATIYTLRTVCTLIVAFRLSYYYWPHWGLYNVVSNAAFTCINFFIIYSIYVSFKKTYSKQEDSFWAWRLIYLCIPPALLVNHGGYWVVDIIWTYTIYLEALAMMPQLYRPSATFTPTVGVFVALTLFHRFLYIYHLIIWDYAGNSRMYLAACIVEIIINLEYLLIRRKKTDAVSKKEHVEGSATGSKDAEVGSNYDKVYSITLTPAALIVDEKANLIENDEKSAK